MEFQAWRLNGSGVQGHGNSGGATFSGGRNYLYILDHNDTQPEIAVPSR